MPWLVCDGGDLLNLENCVSVQLEPESGGDAALWAMPANCNDARLIAKGKYRDMKQLQDRIRRWLGAIPLHLVKEPREKCEETPRV